MIIILIFILFCLLFNNKKENFGCPAGTACCLQGYYGVENRCARCPKGRPSSPRPVSGAPGDDCQCPNNAASSCFACGKCEIFNSKTGVCDKKIGCKA